MILRKATAADLPRMEAWAQEFYRSSKFLKVFDLERFCGLWTALLETTGVMFLLCDREEIAGAIGGLKFEEIYSGESIATEMFWFVREESRGGGLKLYRAFEQWAREQGCSQIRMVHLLDLMPDKLQRVYKHLGFVAAEVHYTKELIL